MTNMFLKRLGLSRWRLHALCALLSLLSCVPILWPRLPLAESGSALSSYAGMLLSGSFVFSATIMLLMVLHLLLRLRNKKACLYLLSWGGMWGCAFLIFVIMALAADVPPLRIAENTQPIQETDTLHPASDELTGPSALVIPIVPETYTTAEVQTTPNLTLLEEEHEAVLTEFLESSPRWAAQADDTFYSRPGHVVMVPPTTGGTPGLVHVCFRRLVEGEPLPQGYRVVKSGEAFPKAPAGQIPDLALDLGRNHYLLLAWRGTSHQETAYKALNAAIAAVDSRMQELAATPTHETALSMAKGKINITGHTPELRLCEPPAQYGAYQAEIYANPHEAGTLLVYVRELETNRTLRILNCPAQYSDNENELFRHDLPGSVPLWMRDGGFSASRNLFAPETPLFAIREGEPHNYFGVAFEVRFKPIDPRQPSRLILRRCYKVEAYEKPAPAAPQPLAGKRAPDDLTPSVSLPAPMATAPDAAPDMDEPGEEMAQESPSPAPEPQPETGAEVEEEASDLPAAAEEIQPAEDTPVADAEEPQTEPAPEPAQEEEIPADKVSEPAGSAEPETQAAEPSSEEPIAVTPAEGATPAEPQMQEEPLPAEAEG